MELAEKKSIGISDKAVEHVKRFMKNEDKADAVVRVGVRGGGCSGLSYVLQFEEAGSIGLMDHVTEKDGVLAFVEVRTRKASGFGAPEESLTQKKRSQMVASAESGSAVNLGGAGAASE